MVQVRKSFPTKNIFNESNTNIINNSCKFLGRDLINQKKTSLKNSSQKKQEEEKKVLIVWDNSLSQGINGEEKNREKDIRLVKELLTKWNKEKTYQEVHILLLNERNDNNNYFYAAKVSEIEKVIQFLKTLKYEGGTNFQELITLTNNSNNYGDKYEKNAISSYFSFCLLFTNGFDVFGSSKKTDLFSSSNSKFNNIPLFFCSSSENRNKMMNTWSRLSGGDVSTCPINKNDYTKEEMDKIGNFSKKVKFLYAIRIGSDYITEFYPSEPTIMKENYLDFAGMC
jgi:hypothetical protein